MKYKFFYIRERKNYGKTAIEKERSEQPEG